MSLTSHVDELRKKHRTLEASIASEERRPAADHVQIHAMKREKLKLKDTIEKLEHNLH